MHHAAAGRCQQIDPAVLGQAHRDQELCEVNNGGGASFAPDGHRIVFSQADIVDQFHFQYDLYLLDSQSGDVRQLTHGARSRSPDVSPDGHRVVFVRNHGGRPQLALIDLSGKNQRDLTSFPDGTQVYPFLDFMTDCGRALG